MKFPIIILAYGDFQTTKKIFMYEKHGVLTIPIYTNLDIAYAFLKLMNERLQEVGADNSLTMQLAKNAADTYDLFVTFMSLRPDLQKVTIDQENTDSDDDTFDIDEFIDSLKSQMV